MAEEEEDGRILKEKCLKRILLVHTLNSAGIAQHTFHIKRHTSRITHHLLLNDIRLALQRLAVALDAIELGLRSGWFAVRNAAGGG